MVSTQADFIRYIACFNNKDYGPQHAFYGPNVSLKLPNIPALVGSEGIGRHYDFIHELADETLDIKVLLFDTPTDPTVIFFESNSWFRFKRDHDHIDPCPAKKGDLVNINCTLILHLWLACENVGVTETVAWIKYTLNADHTFREIISDAHEITNFGNIDLPPVEPGVLRPH